MKRILSAIAMLLTVRAASAQVYSMPFEMALDTLCMSRFTAVYNYSIRTFDHNGEAVTDSIQLGVQVGDGYWKCTPYHRVMTIRDPEHRYDEILETEALMHIETIVSGYPEGKLTIHEAVAPLPGLIMSATDSEGIHTFTLVGLYIESLPIIHEKYYVLSIPTEGGGMRPTIKKFEKRTHEQMVALRNKIFGAKVYPSNPKFSFPEFGASDVETTILNDDCLPNATLINGITILGKAHKFQPLELK